MADLRTSGHKSWLDEKLAKHVRTKHGKSYDPILEGIRTVIGDIGHTRRKLAY